MIRFLRIGLASLGFLALIPACSSTSAKPNVWDSYDVRYETPHLAAPYPADNDSYYVVPDCSIMDAPSCGGD